MGRIIPAGTGMLRYRKAPMTLKMTEELEEPEAAVRPPWGHEGEDVAHG